jgi:large conductance mechanosensitive channel
MGGFRKFLMQGNMIDLAVGVVIGVAFNAIVQALVKDMVGPLIAVLIGNRIDFNGLSFHINGTAFTYGTVINAAISFLVIAAVVYWLIVAPKARVTTLSNRKKIDTERPCPECLNMILVGARRCMYCTAEVSVVPPSDAPAPRRSRHGILPSE